MCKFPTLRLVLLMSLAGTSLAQEPSQPPAQEPSQPPAQEPVQEPPSEPPPRVLGQARSQPEADAWTAITQATAAQEKIQLCHQFLQAFPDSGLTAFVHYNLANLYRQANDTENFILHGEKALEELPDLPDVHAYLSFFYAERGQNAKALERAGRAVELVNTMQKPVQITQAEWAGRKFELNAEAYYAMGRVHLSQAAGATGPAGKEGLAKAIEYLERSLEQAPDHPYAAFRLGEAYVRQQAPEKAIAAYARTVAMGGVIGEYARANLKRMYEQLNRDTANLEEVIAQERELLQQKLGERKQMLEEIASQEQEASETSVAKPPL